MKTTDIRKLLLAGTALVAVGGYAVSPAFATAPEEIVATGNQTPTANDEFVNDVDDTDTIELDLNDVDVIIGNDDATAQTAAIDINAADASFFVTDNENSGDGGGVLTIEADTDAVGAAAIDVANGRTLNFYVGVDDDGTTLADDEVTVVIAGDVEENTSGTVNFIIGGDVDGNSQVLRFNTGTVAQVIDADIRSLTDTEGDVDIDTAATVTINGNIGTSTQTLDDLTIVDEATVIVSGDIYAADIDLDDGNGGTGATLRLTGTNKTVSGTIDSGGGNDAGILDVDGTITFLGAIGGANELDSITIANAGSATFYSNVDIVGAGTGTLTLEGSTANMILGEADAAGNSTVTFTGAVVGSGIVTLVGDDTDAVGHSVVGTVGSSSQSIAQLIVKNDNEEGAATSDVHQLQDDLYADNVHFAASDDAGTTTIGGTLTLNGTAGAATVEIGTITTGVDGDGNLNVTPSGANDVTVTVTGDVGTSTAGLRTITAGLEANAGNGTIDFDGNVYAANIVLDEDSGGVDAIASFTGASGSQTVTADIDGQEAGEGDVVVGNSTSTAVTTFSGQLGNGLSLEAFTINDNATAVLNGANNVFAGDVTVDGNLRLGQGVLLTVNDVAAGAAEGVVEFVIGTNSSTGADEAGTLDLAAAVDWDEFDGTTANSADTLLKQGTGVITNGQDFLIIDGTGPVTNLDAAGEVVDDEYALFNFSAYTGDVKVVGASDNTDVVVEATRVDSSSVTKNSNNAAAADAVLNTTVAQYDADAEFASLYDSISRASTSNIDERVEAVQPTVDGATVAAGVLVNSQTTGIINTQLAALRDGSAETGMTAGNIGNGLRGWAQFSGQTGEQDERDGIDGYDIDSYGVTVGLDTEGLADRWIWGLAFSYINSDVESDNANSTDTDIDTYQVALYANYDLDEATYVAGQLSYAFGDNDVTRHDIGGVAGLDANGDFDSDTFGARVEVGRGYEAGSMTTLTPSLSLNYLHYDADSYEETGAGGAGLESVDSDALNILELGAAVKADWLYQQSNGAYLKPEVRLGVAYDVIGDEVETTSTLIGNGATFKSEGFDAQQFSVDVGAGVTYFSTANWDFTANYDYQWKEDFDSHTGTVRAAYKF